MFEAEIPAAKLKTAVSAVHTLVDECKIQVYDDAIEIDAVDPANVAMVDIRLPAEDFESYEADEDLLGVNLVRLTDILKMANKDDVVELSLDEETRKLEVVVDNLRYTLSLINPDSIHQDPQNPDLDHHEVEVSAGQLKRAVDAAEIISDHMALEVTVDGRLIASADEDQGSDEVEQLVKRLDDTPEEGVRSLYSMKYLSGIVDELPDDPVDVGLGEDLPVRLEAPLADEGDLGYLLAPRIEEA